jgi:hypothetical protein
MQRDDHHDDNRADPTRDRGHACTKHGGIDIWLAL